MSTANLPAPESWRTFIAVDIPETPKAVLSVLKTRVPARDSRSIRWLPEDGIHLTLRFLGDISPDRVPAIADRVRFAASQTAPLRLELGGPGCFPDPREPRVFWVGLRGDLQRLNQLQGRVEGGLSSIGVEPDRRPFHPHLTVGRTASSARLRDAQAAAESFMRLRLEPAHSFSATTLTFYRSHLLKDGARYESLATSVLGAPTEG